jgi:hypothetical protein
MPSFLIVQPDAGSRGYVMLSHTFMVNPAGKKISVIRMHVRGKIRDKGFRIGTDVVDLFCKIPRWASTLQKENMNAIRCREMDYLLDSQTSLEHPDWSGTKRSRFQFFWDRGDDYGGYWKPIGESLAKNPCRRNHPADYRRIWALRAPTTSAEKNRHPSPMLVDIMISGVCALQGPSTDRLSTVRSRPRRCRSST